MQNSKHLTKLKAQQKFIKEYIEEVLQLIRGSKQQHSQSTVPSEDIINGIDVINMPTRIVYPFALELLDMFFTPEELAQSLVYKSKRSDKDGLDKDKVSCSYMFRYCLIYIHALR